MTPHPPLSGAAISGAHPSLQMQPVAATKARNRVQIEMFRSYDVHQMGELPLKWIRIELPVAICRYTWRKFVTIVSGGHLSASCVYNG